MQQRTIGFSLQLCGAVLILLLAKPALAHFPWVNLADYNPNPGAKLKGVIGWGHHYPLDGFLKNEALQSLSLLGPARDTPAFAFISPRNWNWPPPRD